MSDEETPTKPAPRSEEWFDVEMPALDPLPEIADPGVAAVANLIDSHLGAFLADQKVRDEQMRTMVVEVLNQAMVNQTALTELRSIAEANDVRSRNNEKRIADIESLIKNIDNLEMKSAH